MCFGDHAEAREDVWMKDVDKRLSFAQKLAVDCGFLAPGQPVVIVTGWRSGSGYTNTLRVIPYDPEGDNKLPSEE